METQHLKTKGYRELNTAEIEIMIEIKKKGDELRALHGKLKFYNAEPRWVAIGETHLQQGLMAWTRAVGKPDAF